LCHASARQIPREALKRGGSAGDWFSVSLLLFSISSIFSDDWLVFVMMGSISVFQFIFVSIGFLFATVFLVALGF
jgi:hypothetical protein